MVLFLYEADLFVLFKTKYLHMVLISTRS